MKNTIFGRSAALELHAKEHVEICAKGLGGDTRDGEQGGETHTFWTRLEFGITYFGPFCSVSVHISWSNAALLTPSAALKLLLES